MKYIWILILIGIYVLWLIEVIKDIIESIDVVKESRKYDNALEFIKCIGEEVDDITVGFIGANLVGLFIASLVTWLLSIKIGG